MEYGSDRDDFREMVLRRLERLSRSYTPEWRFNREKPDIGSALALIFAGYMEDTLRQYERVLNKHKVEFFRLMGAEAMEGRPSQGYMTFHLVNEKAPETALPAGTGVEAVMEGQKKCLFETEEEAWIAAASVDRDVYHEEGCCYIRFSAPVSGGPVSLLFLIETEKRMDRHLRWEYLVQEGWECTAAEDRTERLCRTGIVRFAGITGMQKSCLFALTGYWIRVRAESGPPLPCEMKVFLNAVKVQAKTAGTVGNGRETHTYKLTRTVGFISKIDSPDGFFCGTDRESDAGTIDRYASGLKHGFRAVTPGDFEGLAKEASCNVLRVKCFTGPVGVTVVVLQRDYLDGRRYFYRIEAEVLDYLVKAAGPSLVPGHNFFVTAPLFIWVDVAAELYTQEYGRVMGIQREAERELEDFCDPVTGGFDHNGWEFGSLPEHYQIKQLFQKIQGVVYVKRVLLTAGCMDDGMRREVMMDELKGKQRVLPLSGRHQITVRVMEG